MLIIKTLFSLVCIPDNIPYIIYSEDYLLDKEGNQKDYSDPDSGKCYEYGDLLIETETVTYRFCKIYSCFQWVAWLNDKIADVYANGNRNAVIDMCKLGRIASEEFNAQLVAEYRNEADNE